MPRLSLVLIEPDKSTYFPRFLYLQKIRMFLSLALPNGAVQLVKTHFLLHPKDIGAFSHLFGLISSLKYLA